MSKPKKSAGEKTSQQTISAATPDKDDRCPPGTIGSNKDLARKEVIKEVLENLPDLSPVVLQYGFHIFAALCYASFLAIRSRARSGFSRDSFIGNYLRLQLHLDCARGIFDHNCDTELLEKWPHSPGLFFGPETGWCALDVAYRFSCRMLNGVLVARTKALGVEVHNQFDYLSINDTRIDKWIEVFCKECEGNTLPASKLWPAWQIRRDGEALMYKLQSEYASAKQAEAGGEAKTPKEPLSKNAEIVYDILTSLPPHKALTAPKILDEVSKKHKKYWDEKELYDRIFPQLKPYGLKNKPRIGYWIEKEKSADAPS